MELTSHIDQFITIVQKKLPVCDNCQHHQNRYCLEKTCARNSSYCQACNVKIEFNRHYLHRYLTLSSQQLNNIQCQKDQALQFYEEVRRQVDDLADKCYHVIREYQDEINMMKYKQQMFENLSKQISKRCYLIESQQIQLQELFTSVATTNPQSFELNQIVQKLRNYVNFHQQIKFSEYIYDQVNQIGCSRIESDDRVIFFNKIKKFIGKQNAKLNKISCVDQHVEISNSGHNPIKIIVSKNKLNKLNQELGHQMININRLTFSMLFGNNMQEKFIKNLIRCALNKLIRIKKLIQWPKAIDLDFAKQQRMIKNKVYQIYRIHKSRLCHYRKSLKLQVLGLFEFDHD